jgi:hypothetical protein
VRIGRIQDKTRWAKALGQLRSGVNSATGKRELFDPESEFIPGETIVKLYCCKRLDGYVSIPGASVFQIGRDGYTLEALNRDFRFSRVLTRVGIFCRSAIA